MTLGSHGLDLQIFSLEGRASAIESHNDLSQFPNHQSTYITTASSKYTHSGSGLQPWAWKKCQEGTGQLSLDSVS